MIIDNRGYVSMPLPPQYKISPIALCQKHFECFVPEYLLQGFGANGLGDRKHSFYMETTIENQDLRVGVKT